MAVTMQQIAEAAKVSRPVVSAVLSGSSQTVRVSEETAERVRQIARKLDYTVQWSSDVLRSGRTHLVGILGTQSSITKIHDSNLLAGLGDGLAEQGLALTFAQAESGNSKLLRDGRFDGCFIDFVVQPKQIEALQAVNLPGVIVNARPRSGIPAVRVDETGTMRRALAQLLEQGHRRIVYVNYAPQQPRTIEQMGPLALRRLEAWDFIGTELPTEIERHRVDVTDSFNQVPVQAVTKSGLIDLLRLDPAARPTAILTFNGRLAICISHMLEDKGLVVPRDLSLLSLSNDPSLNLMRVPISSYREDFYRIGRLATQRMLQLIEHRSDDALSNDIELDTQVPSETRDRASVAPPPRSPAKRSKPRKPKPHEG